MPEDNNNLYDAALACIEIRDPYEKAAQTSELYQLWRSGNYILKTSAEARRIAEPGRPQKPKLVDPMKVPKRGVKSRQGLVRLAHAIAHIEFNAINLALDAVYRFRNMPVDYVSDWLRVAAEESSHFLMLAEYLEDNGSCYGEHDAHNGLWEMALKTDHDVLVRMALVPRVLEARGLDVTPGMIEKLNAVGERKLVAILEVIHQEEIGHVRIGSRWFNHVCQQRGLSPKSMFTRLLNEYMKGNIHGPFDHESRIQAGFTEDEMQQLVEMSRNREAVA